MSRLKIYFVLKRIVESVDENSAITMDAFQQLWSKHSSELRALSDLKCISLIYVFGDPVALKLLNHSFVYILERRELWLNRLFSYLLGLLSGIVIAGASDDIWLFIQALL